MPAPAAVTTLAKTSEAHGFGRECHMSGHGRNRHRLCDPSNASVDKFSVNVEFGRGRSEDKSCTRLSRRSQPPDSSRRLPPHLWLDLFTARRRVGRVRNIAWCWNGLGRSGECLRRHWTTLPCPSRHIRPVVGRIPVILPGK